jgi:hypothetical protein
MRTFIALLGASIAGAAGWWVGAFVGFMTAFVVSTVASGVGWYFARRWADENLP